MWLSVMMCVWFDRSSVSRGPGSGRLKRLSRTTRVGSMSGEELVARACMSVGWGKVHVRNIYYEMFRYCRINA